ncbi:ADP-ribosylation factor-like protein, putative [Bodo saltans]|uniref:ADP-ribosylation factor-like protein, putative n=1 Tax=Bodo saltans TaxID=75058 RepID=A0A0S4JWF1_BODSA|nr:ADP-ribosylation factor-like protein, putative [Bodo saltans]|eukprot:CUG94375.1 ADP-ribosylation factor-like protein, putative [Bodo saltans]
MSTISNSEAEARTQYCKTKNVHHLFELLATKVLLDKPENVYQYLRELLTKVEESEKKDHTHDPTQIQRNDGTKGLLKMTVAIFGIDNAGKTALLSAMGGQVDAETQPTVGFSPTQFQTDKYDICIFDLGGAKNFRGIWTHYFHDCHAVIYVVDASDTERLGESAQVFQSVVGHKFMEGKPILVFANKKDKVPAGQSAESIAEVALSLKSVVPSTTPLRVIGTCAIQEDSSVEAGVEWIFGSVENRYGDLSGRVKKDMAEIQEEKKRKQQARLEALRKQQEEGK